MNINSTVPPQSGCAGAETGVESLIFDLNLNAYTKVERLALTQARRLLKVEISFKISPNKLLAAPVTWSQRNGAAETCRKKKDRLKMATFNSPETAIIAACLLPGTHLHGEYCDSNLQSVTIAHLRANCRCALMFPLRYIRPPCALPVVLDEMKRILLSAEEQNLQKLREVMWEFRVYGDGK